MFDKNTFDLVVVENTLRKTTGHLLVKFTRKDYHQTLKAETFFQFFYRMRDPSSSHTAPVETEVE